MNEKGDKKSDIVINSGKHWLPFYEAKALAQSLKLKNVTEWSNYCKSGNKPNNIPADPSRVYKDRGWKSWDFGWVLKEEEVKHGCLLKRLDNLSNYWD